MKSFILSNGTVFNSRSKELIPADILVVNGAVSNVDSGIESEAETLDCTGCIVSPGFIDCHGHSDDIPLLECDGGSKLYDGVTTEICGNCGWSMFPHPDEPRSCGYRGEYTIESGNFSEYFDYLENRGIPINLGFLAWPG